MTPTRPAPTGTISERLTRIETRQEDLVDRFERFCDGLPCKQHGRTINRLVKQQYASKRVQLVLGAMATAALSIAGSLLRFWPHK